MEELKKEVAELKEIVSKLLELQTYEHNMKYGYINKSLSGINPSKKC